MPDAAQPETSPTDHCAECAATLDHDQRYCLVCGARRAPLPARVAVALGELAGLPAAPPAEIESGTPEDDHRGRGHELLPAARAVAVSILLMLGLGSVIGAATAAGGVTSLGSTIVLAFFPAAHPAPRTIADAGTGSGPSTSAAPGGGGGGGGGGASSAGAPTQTQRTVTVSASPTTSQSTTTGGGTTTSAPTTPTLPPIHHVWEIVLSDQGFQQSFGTTSDDPYLARTLADQGTVISNYDAVATSSLANEVALVSGQGPTPQTLQNCPVYSPLTPGRTGTHGQIRGAGCLYPSSATTLGSELAIDGLSWRAYIQGIRDPDQRTPPSSTSTTGTATTGTTTVTPSSTSTTPSTSTSTSTSQSGSATVTDTSTAAGCPHPAQGATDPATTAGADDGYVTWKNPWMYFDSVVGTPTCAQDDVGLTGLAANLRHVSTTPNFSYIAPDPCDDGSDTPCFPGAKAGLIRADSFLRTVVPEIERSPAYTTGGLILITFDEAPQSGPNWSTASCCGEPTYPNLKGPTTTGGVTSTSTTTSSTSSTSSTTPTTTTTGATTTGAVTTTSGTTTTAPCPTTTDPSTTSTASSTATTSTSSTPAGTTTSTATTPSTTCGPTTTGDPPGGGQVGLLMISPYVADHTLDEIHVYNHFSLLKTVSTLLGVTPPGYAADSDIPSFSPTLFLTTTR